METEAKCPYCGAILEKMPSRKKKCSACKNDIYKRTDPNTRHSILVTAQEREKIDKEWEIENFIKDLKSRLFNEFGFSEKEYKKIQKKNESPYEKDHLWAALNNLAMDSTKRSDFHKAKMIYYEMALFLDTGGIDPFNMLHKARKMELYHHKQSNIVEKVSILTAGDKSCTECKKLEDKKYTIDAAIEQMPIPNPECTHHQSSEHPFCRCIWVADTKSFL